ncbi:Alkylated DNA repair protein alkB-like protein 8 [Armadillidium nasatum]|uniref:Alkylated DNA repair protein alkB-like protein 8 n=1 Tax=Armadillidium nasatum TaxID=96803 RepID=A0A5N5TJY6_9CRUS|nr:Alkylated DNA repair protein alkB-like protein 8 [Armadillidium nasatum]
MKILLVLQIVENFISDKEEKILANLIDWDRKPESKPEGSILKQRDVRHFGYEFDYSSNLVHKISSLNHSIPPELNDICERILKNKIMKEMPDQITVNRYIPGQGIPPHIDTHSAFTDDILSLSILGNILMDFRSDDDYENSVNNFKIKENHFLVYLPARSLCIMTDQSSLSGDVLRLLPVLIETWTSNGEAAHILQPFAASLGHDVGNLSMSIGRPSDVALLGKLDIIPGESGKNLILKQRTERISFTFRKIRSGSCNCLYPLKCDSQNYGKISIGCVKEETSNGCNHYKKNSVSFERDHVLNVYEEIADHFDQTRHKPWPNVLKFVESLEMGSLLLDVGCGNGKYMNENKNIFSVTSSFLYINVLTTVKICFKYVGKKFLKSLSPIVCSLPFRNNVFDAVICIAVIHHLSSQK